MERSRQDFMQRAVAVDGFWTFLDRSLVRLGQVLVTLRDVRQVVIDQRILKRVRESGVLAGPFKGMKYPEIAATGGAPWPKLLGAYESELHQHVEKLKTKRHDVIVNVGCAEGYYAVGFARARPESMVYAFDISDTAQKLCTAMALCNGVSDRVIVDGECSADRLARMDLGNYSLVISDCEGFEKKLFTADSVKNLRHSDVLIEAHDFLDRSISPYLISLFETSHSMARVKSLSDHTKAIQNRRAVFSETNYWILRRLYSEYRPETMDWLIFEPLEK